MEALVASVEKENFKFDIEVALDQQLGAVSLPFPQMDKSTAAICDFYIGGSCQKGNLCPFRHIRENRTVVCKHWLRGLCKKGDQCEFLHEFDMTKMPECYFYTRFNACHNKECPFLHIDPESKVKECPWYQRGFCRHGPNCRHKHVRKVLCLNYLAGFCPDGPNCKFIHASFELPQTDDAAKKKAGIMCHMCGEMGHKSYHCPKNAETQNQEQGSNNQEQENQRPSEPQQFHPHQRPQQPGFHQPYQFHPRPQFYTPRNPGEHPQPRRALEDVICYKCGYKGHYANKCNKGHLAFLSHKAGGNRDPSARN